MAAPEPTIRRSQSPPANLAERELPILKMERALTLFRVHKTKNSPIYFGKTAACRFDDPRGADGRFGTLYAGLDEFCAFIETFGESEGNVVSAGSLSSRSISTLTLAPVRLVNISDAGAAWLGAAGEVSAGEHYLSQTWADQLFNHPQEPDGIYYRARHDLSRFSVALFERGNSCISVTRTVSLSDAQYAEKLAEIMNHYRFGIL